MMGTSAIHEGFAMKGWVTAAMHETSHGGHLSWRGKTQLVWVSGLPVKRARKAQSWSDCSECKACVFVEGKEGCSDGEQLPDWSQPGGCSGSSDS